MSDVRNRKRCPEQRCTRQLNFHVDGTKTVQFCVLHCEGGVVDGRNRKTCIERGCSKVVSLDWKGNSTGNFCTHHIEDVTAYDFSSPFCSGSEGDGRHESDPPAGNEAACLVYSGQRQEALAFPSKRSRRQRKQVQRAGHNPLQAPPLIAGGADESTTFVARSPSEAEVTVKTEVDISC